MERIAVVGRIELGVLGSLYLLPHRRQQQELMLEEDSASVCLSAPRSGSRILGSGQLLL